MPPVHNNTGRNDAGDRTLGRSDAVALGVAAGRPTLSLTGPVPPALRGGRARGPVAAQAERRNSRKIQGTRSSSVARSSRSRS